MALLTQAEIHELIEPILSTPLDSQEERRNFFGSVNSNFFSILSKNSNPRSQLNADITAMSEIERLADGQVPLLIYLQNVAFLVSGTVQEKTIRKFIDKIIQKTSGTPRLDPEKIPEMKEVIIHVDDTVTYKFMQSGIEVAASVAKLKVPSFSNGQPRKLQNNTDMIYLGTGWLLSDSLLITNYHVINARSEGEADASNNDLHLQAKGTLAQFDFDADQMQGHEVGVTELLAWDATLDYVVIRIPSSGRKALPLSKKILDLQNGSVAVNIVQHPGGRSKRYGIRNNLVSASTPTELRYFTDTESGSSGSPVFNDQWEVVALHRAAMYVSDVNFQGKSTAYVNIGTHISKILEDITARFPQIANEIQ